MRSFDTMTTAIKTLQKEGYDRDFQLKFDTLESVEDEQYYKPSEFVIKEVFRFEGMTNPGDSSILFAIETEDQKKGLLVDAYGAKSDPISVEMIDKFQIPNPSKK